MPGQRGRPRNKRIVFSTPVADYFKPRGIPLTDLEVETLTLEELEAIKLADLEGLTQEEAAARMGVSRKAFWRDITSARRKIALALLNGRAIQIHGGNYLMGNLVYICRDCGNRWTVKEEDNAPERCPECGSINIGRFVPPVIVHGPGGRGGGMRRGAREGRGAGNRSGRGRGRMVP